MGRACQVLDGDKAVAGGLAARGRSCEEVDRHGRGGVDIGGRVSAVAAVQRVGTKAADQDIVAVIAKEDIDPKVAPQRVVGGVAGDRIVARATDCVLDDRATGNRDVVDAGGACAGVGFFTQVDRGVLRIAREIEGVVAACVPDGEDCALAGGGQDEACNGRVRVEPVYRVPCSCRHVRAIEALNCSNIVQAWRRGEAGHIAAGVRGAKIAHGGEHARVVEVLGIGGIRDRDAGCCVVVARVAEADRMTDLVQQHMGAVVANDRIGVIADGRVDPDVALCAAERCVGRGGQIGKGRSSGRA